VKALPPLSKEVVFINFRPDIHEHFTTSPADLINTPLQRGVASHGRLWNRFNGFPHGGKTVETVFHPTPPTIAPLKRGVNEKHRGDRSKIGPTPDNFPMP
jgi:hypothetical protein